MTVRTHHTRRQTIARLAVVVVAGSALGVAGAYAAVAAGGLSTDPPVGDLRAELDEVSTWARAHDMAGLSPASLSPVPRPGVTSASVASELGQIAEWAAGEGLTG